MYDERLVRWLCEEIAIEQDGEKAKDLLGLLLAIVRERG